ncbi:MAG: hypothetical protein GY950_19265, partial [bacterium]|nr:hypothetical protein [bacterium]
MSGAKKRLIFIICVIPAILFFGFRELEAGKKYSLKEFPNILNVKNIPAQAKDWNSFCFSDKGAWFGFALPADSSENHLGCFPGPFVMTSGRWLSGMPAKLFLENSRTGKRIDFSKAVSRNITYYPGRLTQVYRFPNMPVELELIFISGTTAVVKTVIQNKSSESVHYKCGWEGRAFDLPVTIEAADGAVKYILPAPGFSFLVKPRPRR